MGLVIEPGKTRIGWIGTGVMGSSMCGRLIEAGYSATVHNRTREKADGLVAAGARLVGSPAEVAAASDVVFTIVGYPRDVREVVLGPRGVLSTAAAGSVLVDMTTSEPTLAVEIARQAKAKGVAALDAPVSGGDVGAREGGLSIMIGGDEAVAKSLRPLFEILGRTVAFQGPPGSGQHTKMVNQTLIASCIVGVCEALLYAHKAGLDPTTVLRSVESGAAGSWELSHLGPRIIAGDYEAGFFVEHFLKDLGIALEESRRMGLVMPGLALAEQLYRAVAAQGMARKGHQALILALAELSRVDWRGGAR